jgi:uncharacterized protein YcgI (DUF1989 family)
LPKKLKKERNVRKRYLQKKAKLEETKTKSANSTIVTCTGKLQSQAKVKRSTRNVNKKATAGTSETICPICSGSFKEENLLEVGTTWVGCDACQQWMHKDCIPIGYSDEMTFSLGNAVEFTCHLCATKASSSN